MQHDVVVPPAEILEVREAGVAAIGEMLDVVRFAASGGLVAAARMLPQSTWDRERASWKTC
jgi:hypothetical protein